MALLADSRLLLRMREGAVGSRSGEVLGDISEFDGDIAFVVDHVNDVLLGLSTQHLGLISSGISSSKGFTGLFSILGQSEDGELTRHRSGKLTLSMSIRAKVLYKELEERLGFEKVGDRFIPSFERFSGKLTGSLVGQVGEGAEVLLFEEGSLILEYEGGGLGWVKTLKVPLSGLSLSLLVRTAEVRVSQFKLKVRPIGFALDESDQSPSGGKHWDRQLRRAVDVWKHCGIDLDVQEFKIVEDRFRKASEDPLFIRGISDPEAKTIEVYFTAGVLGDGGGYAFSCGSALATIVVSDVTAETVENLVAHELGHIFCGVHPSASPRNGEWPGDRGSVLEPPDGLIRVAPLGHESCSKAKNAAFCVNK